MNGPSSGCRLWNKPARHPEGLEVDRQRPAAGLRARSPAWRDRPSLCNPRVSDIGMVGCRSILTSEPAETKPHVGQVRIRVPTAHSVKRLVRGAFSSSGDSLEQVPCPPAVRRNRVGTTRRSGTSTTGRGVEEYDLSRFVRLRPRCLRVPGTLRVLGSSTVRITSRPCHTDGRRPQTSIPGQSGLWAAGDASRRGGYSSTLSRAQVAPNPRR